VKKATEVDVGTAMMPTTAEMPSTAASRTRFKIRKQKQNVNIVFSSTRKAKHFDVHIEIQSF
jgi:hypothetical protein